MERIELPLSELTIPQKLDLLETLWDDLAHHDQEVASPEWHREILEDRDAALAAGKARTSSWEEAKERIQRTLPCK
jgi:putative addiction module component (TIGR02574 family)